MYGLIFSSFTCPFTNHRSYTVRSSHQKFHVICSKISFLDRYGSCPCFLVEPFIYRIIFIIFHHNFRYSCINMDLLFYLILVSCIIYDGCQNRNIILVIMFGHNGSFPFTGESNWLSWRLCPVCPCLLQIVSLLCQFTSCF